MGHSSCIQAMVTNRISAPGDIYPKSALMETPPLPQAVCSRDKYPSVRLTLILDPVLQLQLSSSCLVLFTADKERKATRAPPLTILSPLEKSYSLIHGHRLAEASHIHKCNAYIPKAMSLLLIKTFCSGSSSKRPQRK